MRKLTLAVDQGWLPGFAPEDDPLEVLGAVGSEPSVSPRPIAKAVATIIETAKATKAIWPRLEASVFTGLSGDVTKFEANVAAIELLQKLEAEERSPTDEERVTLNRYTGWGGLPQAFNLQQSDDKWLARAERLKALLSPEEYESASMSTPNAHYTSLEVIEAMWKMVQRLGFKGGRILEPAAGVGYFIGGAPEEIARNSTVTAIELDSLSSKIARALYGHFGVHVEQSGFEHVRLPEGYFDLAISNVPFGNYQVGETRNVPYARFSIHNYFFGKALEVVRPGGLVVFITSSFTMDASDGRVRAYLASQADLVAAIRLPNVAFKRIANTEVTTDILVLQKPLNGKPKGGDKWHEAVWLPESSPIHGGGNRWSYYRESILCNKWFAEHPEWVIGKLALTDNGHGKSTGCVWKADEMGELDLAAELAKRIEMLPDGIYTSREEDSAKGNVVALCTTAQQRPGFRVINGKVYEITGHEAVLVKAPAKTLERIAALCEIRDAARHLIDIQRETEDEEIVRVYRTKLNVLYDAFVAKHGYIHARSNKSAFKGDPDLPLLLSLERWDEENQTAEKADIFFKRTVGVYRRVERCETPQEALLVSLAEHGRIVPDRIGELLGVAPDEAMAELEGMGLVFLDPETDQWETADAYLSGNVRHKMAVAKVAGERFAANVKALEAVIPADLAPHEICARLGSTWIPVEIYEQFINELLGS